MKYTETLSDEYFSHHVESYWEVNLLPADCNGYVELLLPTCTFNILFLETSCFVKWGETGQGMLMNRGAIFLGQTNKCVYINSDKPMCIKGVRLKPFALANIIDYPLQAFNNRGVTFDLIFGTDKKLTSHINGILQSASIPKTQMLLDEMMNTLLSKKMHIDERLRAQLNYILDRQGCIKISDLFSEFNVSKVTMREHFINKVGIVPKKVSQIWRMNRMLFLKTMHPTMNLTNLSFESGFYDQSHFIRDFKLLFDQSPKKFFRENDEFIAMSSDNITKRFTKVYDPRLT